MKKTDKASKKELALAPKRGVRTAVTATDAAGKSRTFKSVKECALYLEVSSAAVCQALRLKCKCRGCSLARG